MSLRRRLLYVFATAAFAATALFGASGCAGALLMPYYLIYGTDAQPIFKEQVKEIPKESTMVVICRSNLNLFGQANPNADLATSVTYLISNNLKDRKKKKLVWLPFERVEELFDEEAMNSESFEKMGKKLGADYVVGIELDEFEYHHSAQFYQGRGKVLVRLIDVEKGETIARQSPPTYVYPPTPVPVSDLEEIEFQKTFTVKLATQISNMFCPHDPHDGVAADSDFPNR